MLPHAPFATQNWNGSAFNLSHHIYAYFFALSQLLFSEIGRLKTDNVECSKSPIFVKITEMESFALHSNVLGGQLKYGKQFFFVTAWYKKICARKNGWWREISVRDECFIKTLFRILCCSLLAGCCKGNFQKSLDVLWNVTCVVASRLLGGSDSQIFKRTSQRPMCILKRYK